MMKPWSNCWFPLSKQTWSCALNIPSTGKLSSVIITFHGLIMGCTEHWRNHACNNCSPVSLISDSDVNLIVCLNSTTYTAVFAMICAMVYLSQGINEIAAEIILGGLLNGPGFMNFQNQLSVWRWLLGPGIMASNNFLIINATSWRNSAKTAKT